MGRQLFAAAREATPLHFRIFRSGTIRERRTEVKLTYVIKFVGDMNRAVKFYRDVLGFQLKFESPEWSEFVTGETAGSTSAATSSIPRRCATDSATVLESTVIIATRIPSR